MKKMRAGVIGIGFTGAAHVEALRRLGYVEVAAITSASDAQRKAEDLYVPKGYTDYREMIDQEKLDCIHICTPNSMHFEMAMDAMERGISVICEKPLTVTTEQAMALRDYALDHRIVNCVNFSLRMNPQVVRMREMVRSGEVGDIFTVHGSYLQDWLYYDTDWSWRMEPQFSGNTRAMSDIGTQWIDMVEFIIGQKVVEVMADFATFHKTRKKLKQENACSDAPLQPEDYVKKPVSTEDYCTVILRFENGTRGVCTVSEVYAGRKNQQIISIGGSKCALHWDSELANELWVGRRDEYNQQIVSSPSLMHGEMRKGVSYPSGYAEGLTDTFKQNFHKVYQAIAEGNAESGDFATFEDGYHEMYLNEKVFESAKKRCWMRVD